MSSESQNQEVASAPLITFADLGLPEHLLAALHAVGYESPSPIQAETIPPLLAGRDVLGQAQTGTGKTAAFALPILAELDLKRSARNNPQALVLAPTRELAIQVAEAFQKYADSMPGFHVLPIYGGQSYTPQLKGLQRGAHVVVGTPGRVIDHLEKGSLDLSHVSTLVLDEADEMLRMGFVDDVEAILQRIPASRRIALFSATMPRPIARIAETYLRDPVRVAIAAKTTTASTVRQRYWQVSGLHKLDALTRILEVEEFDGMIIFSRTKLGTEELATKLEARGFSAAAINGDMPQALRERTINRLKDGQLDILVATDVAARGLDVERISHVVNFDIPLDTESYVHRIGRTGRAGRAGDAILFMAPRERHLLRAIERATRQPIEPMTLPSVGDINTVRISRFKSQITEHLASGDLDQYRSIIESFENEQNVPAIEVAAALARMAQGGKPLLLKPDPKGERARTDGEFADKASKPFNRDGAKSERFERPQRAERPERFERPERANRFKQDDSAQSDDAFAKPKFGRGMALDDAPVERRKKVARPNDDDKQTYKIAVGHVHMVKPGAIVGAIANEVGLDSQHIGRIDIFDDYTLVDLPEGMPAEHFQHLKKVRVAGQRLMIEVWDGKKSSSSAERDTRHGDRQDSSFAKRSKFSDRFAGQTEQPRFDRPVKPKTEGASHFANKAERSDRPARTPFAADGEKKTFKKFAGSASGAANKFAGAKPNTGKPFQDDGFAKPKKAKTFKPGKKY